MYSRTRTSLPQAVSHPKLLTSRLLTQTRIALSCPGIPELHAPPASSGPSEKVRLCHCLSNYCPVGTPVIVARVTVLPLSNQKEVVAFELLPSQYYYLKFSMSVKPQFLNLTGLSDILA